MPQRQFLASCLFEAWVKPGEFSLPNKYFDFIYLVMIMMYPKVYEGMCLCQEPFISKYFYIHVIISYLLETASYLLSIQQ